MFKNSSLYLYSLLFLIFALLAITRVIPDGFHPDSLVYMSMGRNLADGEFSFWHLHFTNNLFNEFYEHPPLGIYLISVAFSLFGDTIFVDKLYGLFLGLLMMLQIMLIFNLIGGKHTRSGAFLAAFYFIAFPIVSNTLENNLLEIPAALFALSSVYIFLYGVIREKPLAFFSFLFTLAMFLAFLSKGFVALFPLALPSFYFLLFREKYNFSKMIYSYLYIALYSSIAFMLLYLYEPSHHYFSAYFEKQIVASLEGSKGAGEHFKLLSQLLVDVSSISLISFIIIVLSKVKVKFSQNTKMFWLFLLIGLSASLPLEISPKQHDYYIFPALAYFAITLSLFFTGSMRKVVLKFGGKKFLIALNILFLVLFIGISLSKVGTYKRHQNFYHDFIKAGIVMSKGASVEVCSDNSRDGHEFFENTEITGNLERYYRINLYKNKVNTQYYLTTKKSAKGCKVDLKKYKYIGRDKPNYYLLYKAI